MQILLFALLLSNAYASDSCHQKFESALRASPISELEKLAAECPEFRSSQNAMGETLLFTTAREGLIPSLEWLLAQKMDVNAKNESGCNALCKVQNAKAAELLLAAGIEVSITDNRGFTPFYHLLGTKDFSLLDRLLASGAEIGEAELYWASANYEQDLLTFLSERVKEEAVRGKGSFFRYFDFYQPEHQNIATTLIAKGADLNQAKLLRTGMLLLESYIEEYVKNSSAYGRHGNSAIRYLLEHGADANGLSSRFGRPILFYALGWRTDAHEVAQELLTLFLAHGYRLDLRDEKEGKNLLMDLASLQVRTPAQNAYVATIVRSLLKAGLDPNSQSNDGRTALHWAIRAANAPAGVPLAVVSDLTLKDGSGQTPLEFLRAQKEFYRSSKERVQALEAIGSAMAH